VTETECVYCAVWTGSLYVIKTIAIGIAEQRSRYSGVP